jgi:hypothetical protein
VQIDGLIYKIRNFDTKRLRLISLLGKPKARNNMSNKHQVANEVCSATDNQAKAEFLGLKGFFCFSVLLNSKIVVSKKVRSIYMKCVAPLFITH